MDKKAILMSFRVNDNSIFSSGISNSRGGNTPGLIKLILKHLAGLKMNGQKEVLDRSGSIIRYSAYW